MTDINYKYGYVRVSSYGQNSDRQLADIECDKIFTDKVSGSTVKRPALRELLSHLRSGDTLLVHSMDRLARNLDDLRELVTSLTQKGVQIEFVKEKLVFAGESSPMATLMLSVMGAFAEFERALIRERQLEGIAIAKKKGKYRGRKPALSNEQVVELKRRVAEGERKSTVAKAFHISRETLYKYLKS